MYRKQVDDMPPGKTLAIGPVRNGRGIVALNAFWRGAMVCEITGKKRIGKSIQLIHRVWPGAGAQRGLTRNG